MKATQSVTMPTMRKGVILVVEDDPVSAQAVGQMLTAEPGDEFEVLFADRIAAAADLLAKQAIGCVFLDLGLPDAAGLTGLRRLRGVAPTVPIIVVTATDDEMLAAQAIQEGARDYVPKSAVTMQVIRQLAREVLGRDAAG